MGNKIEYGDRKKVWVGQTIFLFVYVFFFFLSNYLKSYNIGITETWERKKRESQKLSKWGVVKLVGSGKLKNGVDKVDVREKKKNNNNNWETWTWYCDHFNFWI